MTIITAITITTTITITIATTVTTNNNNDKQTNHKRTARNTQHGNDIS